MPSSSGQPGQGKKIGHRGVDASGETTYKKVRSIPALQSRYFTQMIESKLEKEV